VIVQLRAFIGALLVISVVACSAAPPTSAPAATNSAPASSELPASPSAGQSSVSPTAQPQTSPPIPQLPEGPTSSQLILEAVEAGALDELTALEYRVYAAFGDSRLPPQYDSGRITEDGAALAAAVQQLDNLPTDVATKLRPFLLRPTDPEGVFQGQAAGVGQSVEQARIVSAGPLFQIGNPFTPADFVCEATGWGHIDGGSSLSGPAWKVWAQCNDPAGLTEAVAAAGDMDLFWREETNLMGTPIPDGGGRLEAGDGPIDIYLANGTQCASTGGRCLNPSGPRHMDIAGYSLPAATFVSSGNAPKSSGFIVLLRPYAQFSPSTLAHELFHVLENAYNAFGTLNAGGRWNWFVEASAKWAQWRFHKPSRADRVYPYFQNFLHTEPGLTTVDGKNEYSSLVWPYFLQLKGGGDNAIQRTWAAIVGKADNANVDAAINSVLPFASNFKDFAATAYNDVLRPTDPVSPHFWDLDAGLPKQAPGDVKWVEHTLPANPKGTPPLEIQVSQPPLSIRYTDLIVTDEVRQVVVDFSSIAPQESFDPVALLDIKDHAWQRRDLGKGVTRFCRDRPAEDVGELIIAVANHEYEAGKDLRGHWEVQSLADPCALYSITIDWVDSYDGIEDGMHFVGDVDQVDLALSNKDTQYLTGTGTVSGDRFGWQKCNPGIDLTPSGTVSATFYAVVDKITQTVTVNAWADADTDLAGISTGFFVLDIDGGRFNIDPGPSVGEPCPHFSYGEAFVERLEQPPP
jgi:hypothetical protein